MRMIAVIHNHSDTNRLEDILPETEHCYSEHEAYSEFRSAFGMPARGAALVQASVARVQQGGSDRYAGSSTDRASDVRLVPGGEWPEELRRLLEPAVGPGEARLTAFTFDDLETVERLTQIKLAGRSVYVILDASNTARGACKGTRDAVRRLLDAPWKPTSRAVRADSRALLAPSGETRRPTSSESPRFPRCSLGS